MGYAEESFPSPAPVLPSGGKKYPGIYKQVRFAGRVHPEGSFPSLEFRAVVVQSRLRNCVRTKLGNRFEPPERHPVFVLCPSLFKESIRGCICLVVSIFLNVKNNPQVLGRKEKRKKGGWRKKERVREEKEEDEEETKARMMRKKIKEKEEKKRRRRRRRRRRDRGAGWSGHLAPRPAPARTPSRASYFRTRKVRAAPGDSAAAPVPGSRVCSRVVRRARSQRRTVQTRPWLRPPPAPASPTSISSSRSSERGHSQW